MMIVEFPEPNVMRLGGDVKTIENYVELKRRLTEFIASGEKELTIEITDSMSINSSIIGFFTKIIHRDGISLSLKVHDKKLYSLLCDLNLIKFFNVRQF